MIYKKTILLLGVLLTFTFHGFSQITKEQAEKAWNGMSKMVIETANAMPAEHYEFTPHPDLRDFASQVGHTLGANYLFAPVVKRERPETFPEETKEKEQILSDLRASFDFIAEGLHKLSAEDLNEEIEWFGQKMSRLQAILTMTDHLQREHGKTITYVRLKGITPAQSAGW